MRGCGRGGIEDIGLGEEGSWALGFGLWDFGDCEVRFFTLF